MNHRRYAFVQIFRRKSDQSFATERLPADNEAKAFSDAKEAAERCGGAAGITVDRDAWGAIQAVSVVARFGEVPEDWKVETFAAELVSESPGSLTAARPT